MSYAIDVQITATVPWYLAGHLSALASVLLGDLDTEIGADEQRAIKLLLENAAEICHPDYMLEVARMLETQAELFRVMKGKCDNKEPPTPPQEQPTP